MTSDLYQSAIELQISPRSAKNTAGKQIPVSEQLINAYTKLINMGTDAINDSRQVKYIKICNFTAMTSLIASLVYGVLSLLWANLPWFIAVNTLCICSVGVLYLNKTRRIYQSRVLYLVSVNILLYVTALIIGPYTYAENFLLIAVLIPFLIYDIDKVKIIMAGVTLPVVLLISYQYVEPLFGAYHLSIVHQSILRAIGVPMEVGLAIAAVFQFVYYSRLTEIELEASNQQLTIHTTELKRSNADLEQFAYVISHDLKAPVRNISGFMKLLATKHAITLDAEASEFVDFAVKSAKRMERLIDDVLAYSRIGRNLSPPTPVNLNDVVNTVRYELKGKPEMTNATITIDRELPVVDCVHSSLMYHIFQNLIRNGLKFNKNAHPEIRISWQDKAEHYIFSVHDNGIGISKKYSAQVFQMFKRLHGEGEYDGTGIGLAICKKIVEQYNGEIWFESEEGHDTTFYFSIRKY